MAAICSICGKEVNASEAPILFMSGAGIPRLVCEHHARLIDTATESREPAEIKSAIAELGEDMLRWETDDMSVIEIINGIIESAAERADLIEKGEYDFSLDEAKGEEDDFDLTPDMLETEEDRAKTEAEEKRNKILDTVLTWAMGLAIVAAVGFFIFKFIL